MGLATGDLLATFGGMVTSVSLSVLAKAAGRGIAAYH
jgi:hypothetical protein